MNVDDVSRLELLLGDIRDAFAKKGGVEIASADLVSRRWSRSRADRGLGISR